MERCGRVVAVALDQLTERQTDEAAQKNGAIDMAELWGRTGSQIRAWIAEESGAG